MTAEKPTVPEIRARLEAATPGPWEVDTNYPFSDDLVGIFVERTKRYAVKFDPERVPSDADATLIAHAPTDIAFLLEENAQLSKVIREAWQVIDHNCEAYRILTGPAQEGGSDV